MRDWIYDIIPDSLNRFWRQNPALLYGLAFLLGTAIALYPGKWILIFPFLALFFPLLLKRSWSHPLANRLLLGLLTVFLSFLYVQTTVTIPPKNEIGSGVFSISSIERSDNFYSSKWIYKGKIKQFIRESDNKIAAKNIPCIAIPPAKSIRPPADCNYHIKGTLKPSSSGGYNCYLTTKERWIPQPNTFSFAEYRFQAKKALGNYITDQIPSKRCAMFLNGIATGEFSDKEMKYEFSRFGLQHIMAISGFHFAIVAGFFSLFLRQFMSRKRAAVSLIFILCSYFLFLGSSASIMRAWLMILVVVGGYLLERRGSALNSLGLAIAVVLFIDPLMIKHIGFQYSMMITASILLNFELFDLCIQRFFPKRNLSEVIEMSLTDQHAYCLITFFRKALALTLAVNIVAMPLSLYHFHKFPLMSLVYNWFFPFMVSISIVLLIMGLLFSFIPLLAGIFHLVNDKFTNFMLNFAYNLPCSFDYYIRTHEISDNGIIVMLVALFFCSVVGREYLRFTRNQERDFAFI
ncbi:MAG: ComEC/Rec2 family competence protein [Chlamydiota bacterium]|nr:ComEC/Rec2 family competence protein [Chlamydiota bacterium]